MTLSPEASVLWDELFLGYEAPLPAKRLATYLGISERRVGALVAELRKAGYLVGSTCGPDAGYFRCHNAEDVRRGMGHIIARASQSLAVVRAVQRTAEARFGPQTASLFDLEGS